MVHRVAPPRLTAAFGVMLVAGGLAMLARATIAHDTAAFVIGAMLAVVLGVWTCFSRDRLSYTRLGWISVACVPIVGAIITTRDVPYGGGYALAWGAPFAYAAGRRIGIVHTLAGAGTLALAFLIQADRLADPLPFERYFSSWLTAVITIAIVGAVTRVIYDSLERTQRQLDAAFEQGVLGQAFFDLTGHWVQVNRAFAAMLGRTPEELAGMHATALTHPDDRALPFEQLTGAAEHGTVVFDKRYMKPDGSTTWVKVHAAVLRDDHGTPTGLFAE